MTEPQLHQSHKNFSTCIAWAVEVICLLVPLSAEFRANLFKKNGELIKFLFALG
jgi:hypothetical protein